MGPGSFKTNQRNFELSVLGVVHCLNKRRRLLNTFDNSDIILMMVTEWRDRH